jgi:hypothetical protein
MTQPTTSLQQQTQLANAEAIFMQCGLRIKFRGYAAIEDDIMQPIISAETAAGSTVLFVARGADFHLALNPFRDYGLAISGVKPLDTEVIDLMIEHGENLRADADPYDQNPPFQFSCCGCAAAAKGFDSAKRVNRKNMKRKAKN